MGWKVGTGEEGRGGQGLERGGDEEEQIEEGGGRERGREEGEDKG